MDCLHGCLLGLERCSKVFCFGVFLGRWFCRCLGWGGLWCFCLFDACMTDYGFYTLFGVGCASGVGFLMLGLV